MYTKILAQGAEFGSGATGLDNPGEHASMLCAFCTALFVPAIFSPETSYTQISIIYPLMVTHSSHTCSHSSVVVTHMQFFV